MSRLPHLTVCLLGALLLMSFCWAEVEENDSDFDEYGTTHSPDYDYNATFDYSFYSNSSNDDLEKFFKETEVGVDVVTDTEATPTEDGTEATPTEDGTEAPPTEGGTVGYELEEVEEVEEVVVGITKPPSPRNIPTGEACRSTSPCLLITLGLLSHLGARLL